MRRHRSDAPHSRGALLGDHQALRTFRHGLLDFRPPQELAGSSPTQIPSLIVAFSGPEGIRRSPFGFVKERKGYLGEH